MMDRPSAEDFSEWRNGACGKWFFDQYLPSRETQMKAAWATESWDGGSADQTSLNKYRAVSLTLEQVREAEYEGILQDLGIGVEDE